MSSSDIHATSVDRLLAVSSEPLSAERSTASFECPGLSQMLGRRNGFLAFLSSLHVLPDAASGDGFTIQTWNDPRCWRSRYPEVPKESVAFAEDIFGNQFLASPDGVHTFDPETAEMERLASGIDEWCEEVMNDSEYLTGYPLAEQWQEVNGAIPAGMRLVPAVPFVLGGDFAVDNLIAMEACRGMLYRADIADKVRGLPDGSRLVLYSD